MKLLCVMMTISSVVMAWQAIGSSPLYDEPAHLVSGLILCRKGDYGYYAVNPPINRLLAAIPVELFMSPKLPSHASSRQLSRTSRPEFPLGDEFIALNQAEFFGQLVLARLVRIPIVVGSSLILFWFFPHRNARQRALTCLLWLSSPIVLGHGWVLSSDVLAGVAALLLMLSLFRWLEHRTKTLLLTCGIAWGIAIGTKFTFCAIYLLTPLLFFIYLASTKTLRVRPLASLLLGHLIQGVIALMVVCVLYDFSELGVSLAEHDFQSPLFRKIVGCSEWIATLRSPFPFAFLAGIDTQLYDMRLPRGTFLFGHRIEGVVRWYYLLCYPAKEQLAAWAAAILSVGYAAVAVFQKRPVNDKTIDQTAPEIADLGPGNLSVAIAFVAIVFTILSANGNLVWNIRYVTPALPALYFAIAAGFPEWPLVLRRWRIDLMSAAVFLLVLVELVNSSPNNFSYINPVFGGSYQCPPVLHDSNFDFGQDRLRVQRWVRAQNLANAKLEIFGEEHGVGLNIIKSSLPASDLRILRRAVEERATPKDQLSQEIAFMLVVPTIFACSEEWNIRKSTVHNEPTKLALLRTLLTYEPDEFVTPTHAVYKIRTNK